LLLWVILAPHLATQRFLPAKGMSLRGLCVFCVHYLFSGDMTTGPSGPSVSPANPSQVRTILPRG